MKRGRSKDTKGSFAEPNQSKRKKKKLTESSNDSTAIKSNDVNNNTIIGDKKLLDMSPDEAKQLRSLKRLVSSGKKMDQDDIDLISSQKDSILGQVQLGDIEEGVRKKKVLEKLVDKDNEPEPDKKSKKKIKNVEGEEGPTVRRFEEDEGAMYEPFNLGEEREDGFYDESGFYVRSKKLDKSMAKRKKLKEKLETDGFLSEKDLKDIKAEDEEENEEEEGKDTWADGLEDAEHETQLKHDKNYLSKQREREKELNKKIMKNITTKDSISEERITELKQRVIDLLEDDDETVQEALNRMQPSKENKEHEKEFNELNEITFELSTSGYINVYSDTKSEMIEKLNKYRDEVLWEFKWENKKQAESYGPYSTDVIRTWLNQGNFSGYDVVIRKYVKQDQKGDEEDDDDMFGSDEKETEQLEFVSMKDAKLYLYK